MNYLSTRGAGPVSFEEALLGGLADDGGLYMPQHWPDLPSFNLDARYEQVASGIAQSFAADCFGAAEWDALIDEAYSRFEDASIAPLRELEPDLHLLELFHGPTCAFKDFAMQVLARAFDAVLKRRNMKRTILVATSGDTGAAAVEALRGLETLSLVVLHPKGRISDVQRKQMTTCDAANVRNVAIDGTFDDCQALVKQAFADEGLRGELGLGAVNSINWVRIVAQIPYFVFAARQLGAAPAFSVPTGNFGDIFAGYAAIKMGLEAGPLVIATNENDILHRTLTTGTYKPLTAHATHSPAMDIQVASNFERLLFDTLGGDTNALNDLMRGLRDEGAFTLPSEALARMRHSFRSARVSNAETRDEIGDAFDRYGVLIDPHTAVGLRAARETLADFEGPKVVLSTAHPAKFPDTIKQATGQTPDVPQRLQEALAGDEYFASLPANLEAVSAFLRAELT